MKVKPVSQAPLARMALLLAIASICSCQPKSDGPLKTLILSDPEKSKGHTYATQFQQTERPLSESGNWAVGSSAGASLREGGHFWHRGRLWGDVQVSPGFAFGVDEPTEYGDPTAILTGSWGPEQTVTAVVKINRVPLGTCCHEVELRLRTEISNLRISGYEAYCSIMPAHPYCHIARWNGPNGSYWNLEAQSPKMYVSNGDVMKATVNGTKPTVISLFVNGKKVAQAFDTGAAGGGFGAFGPWTSGNPGIGFYDEHDGNWKDFGFSSFSATDAGSSGANVSAEVK